MVKIACRSPLIAWQHKFFKTKKGKNVIVFSDKKRNEKDRDIRNWEQIEIPCGQCIDCRLQRAKEWRIRLYLEMPKHNYRYFITLTYNDEHLPINAKTKNTSLRKSDVQKFLKRWRKGTKEYKAKNLKYFYCGEYGTKGGRPHYHIIRFTDNEIPDLKYWTHTKTGLPTWRSNLIEKIWTDEKHKPIGNVLIGTVTFDSCGYVRRYITKKELGETRKTYKLLGIQEPYINMSNGIGKIEDKRILDLYIYDQVTILKNDHIVNNKPGKFYDEKLRELEPKWYEKIKENRKTNAIAERESNLTVTGLTSDEYRNNQARKRDKKYKTLERDL